MKKHRFLIISLITLAVLYTASIADAQSINRLRQQCPAPNGTRFAVVGISAAGDIQSEPCPNKQTGVVGVFKTYDPTYVSPFFPTSVTRISSGSVAPQVIPPSQGYTGFDLYSNLSASNTTFKSYIGIGNFVRMNGAPSGTSSIFGAYTNVDSTWGAVPLSEVYGGFYNVDIASSSITLLAGVSSTARIGSVNAGNVTNMYGARNIAAWGYASNVGSVHGVQGLVQGVSGGFGGIATNVRVVHAARANIDAAVTNFCWLCAGGGSTGGVTGAITNNYGVYIGSDIDQGTNRYAIFSQSVAPSALTGDIAILDNTKGMILRSPDGSCYRFTVANGGALNAGVLVTCP